MKIGSKFLIFPIIIDSRRKTANLSNKRLLAESSPDSDWSLDQFFGRFHDVLCEYQTSEEKKTNCSFCARNTHYWFHVASERTRRDWLIIVTDRQTQFVACVTICRSVTICVTCQTRQWVGGGEERENFNGHLVSWNETRYFCFSVSSRSIGATRSSLQKYITFRRYGKL